MTTESAIIVQHLWNYCSALREVSLEETANLPEPDVLAAKIVKVSNYAR